MPWITLSSPAGIVSYKPESTPSRQTDDAVRVTAVEDRSQAKDVIEDTSYAPRMDANARRDLMQKLARTEAPPAPPSRPPP